MLLICSTPKSVDWRKQMPKIYAYRGGAGYFAENTLKAFEFAIEQGCAGAELDVHLTKDGEVVVHHNDKLNHKFARKTNGNWITPEEETPLSQLTLEQVQQYTVGEPSPKTHNHKTWPNLLPEPNQTIPTLAQVIELAKERSDSFELIIEIKTDIFDTHQAWLPLVEKVLDIIQHNHFTQRVKFCSFNWNALLYIQQQAPDIPLWFTTHPLSWLQEGEVPKTDIPPRSETLQNIRQAWLSGNAPWYAGHQPISFEDFPKVINQLGGEAWFCYHTDATMVNLTTTHDQQLQLATWSVNLRDAVGLEKLNFVDAICVDYPKYRFVKPSTELKNFLAIADQARNEKKWQQAEHYYQLILDAYPEYSPVWVYKGLAICQRMQKKFDESFGALNQGLDVFINTRELLTEKAALYNQMELWNEALECWSKAKSLQKVFNILNYSRYLKALEKNGEFERYKMIALEAVSNKPESEIIKVRYMHANAIAEFNRQNWLESYNQFTVLRKLAADLKEDIGTLYYFEEAFLQKQLLENKIAPTVKSDNHPSFNARRFAGVLYYLNRILVACKKVDENLSFLICAYEDIISFIKSTDANLMYRQSEKFISCIKYFSKALKVTPIEPNLLPKEVWFNFANLFLLARDYESYFMARENALSLYSGKLDQVYEDLKSLKDFSSAVSELNDEKPASIFIPDESTLDCASIAANHLYFGQLDVYKNFSKNYLTKDEVRFSEYADGKRLAIVGPINSEDMNGGEIDSFDIVLRFNYRGATGYDPKIFGSKTNMSFYITKDLPRNTLDKRKIDCMNDLDWVISDFDHKKNDKCFNGLMTNLRPRYKAGHAFANPFFKGTPNGVQRALLDLLRFDFKEIKVFNTNLFLDNNYAESYRTGKQLDVNSFIFTHHDPVSNFVFLQRLYEHKIISADTTLSKVLALTKKEYVDALQDRYGFKESNE